MPREAESLEQFLKVVGKSEDVELHDTVAVVDASRVNITVDEPLLIQMSHGACELSKETEDLVCGELDLAELLPATDVLGGLRAEHQSLDTVHHENAVGEVHQIRVVKLLHFNCDFYGHFLLLRKDVLDVDKGQHIELGRLLVPLDDNLALLSLGVEDVRQDSRQWVLLLREFSLVVVIKVAVVIGS